MNVFVTGFEHTVFFNAVAVKVIDAEKGVILVYGAKSGADSSVDIVPLFGGHANGVLVDENVLFHVGGNAVVLAEVTVDLAPFDIAVIGVFFNYNDVDEEFLGIITRGSGQCNLGELIAQERIPN